MRSVGSGVSGAVLAPTAAMTGLAALSVTGAVTGLSGVGMMSGLATAGGLIGGGAAAGPTVIAATPAILVRGLCTSRCAMTLPATRQNDRRAGMGDGPRPLSRRREGLG